MVPRWLTRGVVDAIQEDQRQQHGGYPGVLNEGSVESALARPRNRFEYKKADLWECAACYIVGLAKNHGYRDANKRTAYMSGWTFLFINGYRVDATPEDVIQLMLDVATGAKKEAAIAKWLRGRAAKA